MRLRRFTLLALAWAHAGAFSQDPADYLLIDRIDEFKAARVQREDHAIRCFEAYARRAAPSNVMATEIADAAELACPAELSAAHEAIAQHVKVRALLKSINDSTMIDEAISKAFDSLRKTARRFAMKAVVDARMPAASESAPR